MEINNNLPPADQPDWDGPYNWEWFKYHHLDTLNTHADAIKAQFEQLPKGQAYPPDEIAKLLAHLDELIKLHNWLPSSSGGQGGMNEVIKKRNALAQALQQNDGEGMSWWVVQEIDITVFDVQNYMNDMCED